MAVGSVISPERRRSLPSVQYRYRHGEEAQKYQSVRKRSSKDWYPPEMAFVRSGLHARRMTMDKNPQWTGPRDDMPPCQDLRGNLQRLENKPATELANKEKEVFII
ncbi:hypothetical protein VZT92_017030 [Zoarces viviparus]|uniref:Uncharacterized protein n=1 Tax=Zoarces viviparus TaxID=48416 RepID=A0AAW1EQX5_ZOAVI